MIHSISQFDARVYVLALNNELQGKVSAVEAFRYCQERKAQRVSRRAIRLTGHMELHPCRTRTGRKYTRREALTSLDGERTGHYATCFKPIYAEDRPYFTKSVTDCIVFK